MNRVIPENRDKTDRREVLHDSHNVVQFIHCFTVEEIISTKDLILISDSVYQAHPSLTSAIDGAKRRAFCIGTFLGKTAHGKFFPSFQLLDVLLPKTGKKITLNNKASWLFVCGRDVLNQGIISAPEGLKVGDMVLLQNENQECLGLGEWREEKKMAIKRLLDRGDFLRRERRQ